jgi:hypothetical protein
LLEHANSDNATTIELPRVFIGTQYSPDQLRDQK